MPFPCSYFSTFNGCQLVLILTAFCVTGIIGLLLLTITILLLLTCDWLLLLAYFVFLSLSESILVLLKLLHMVGAGFYVVLFFSFHLDFSLVALHALSYILLCSPLSYKCNFPSKTSSLKHYHLCKVVLNMHLCFFCSYSLLFFQFTRSCTVCLVHGFFPVR